MAVTNGNLVAEADALLAGIPEVRRLLGGVSKRTVLRLLDDGELRRVRIRGRTMTPYADVVALVVRQTEDTVPDTSESAKPGHAGFKASRRKDNDDGDDTEPRR